MTTALHTGWAGLLLPYLLAFGMIVPAEFLQAQNTAIVVQQGSSVNVDAGTTVLKDADLYCNGQWQSNGTTLFTGVNATSMSGTGTIRFSTAEIAKSQPAALTLNTALQITNALNFRRGLIDLNGRVLQLTGTARVSGESDSGRITGLHGGKVIAAPVNANAPNQLNVGNLGAMLTSTANLGLLNIDRSSVPVTGNGIGIQRTYLIQPQNNTALNATLRFYYLDAELNNNDPTKLNLWKSVDGIAWTLVGADTRDTGNHYVEKAGIADFSYWTLASLASSLPLKLISFSAVCAGDYALVEWKTGMESQLNDFLIQRSADGSSWSALGSVPAKNIADGTSYSFKDDAPQPHSFYRLKIEDRDGVITYSPIFSGGCSDIALPFLLYPNPATSQVVAQISLRQAAKGKVQVTNISGAFVYEADWNLNTGINQLIIPVSGLARGTYTLRLILADNVQTTRFIKL